MKSLHPSLLLTNSQATNSKNTTPALSPLAKAIRLSVLGLGLAHCAANAATINVTTNLDNDFGCTLREAILSINNGSVGSTGCNSSGFFGNNDSITFNSGLDPTITLESGALVINNDVSIDASNISTGIIRTGITVNGNNSSRVFEIENATVSMNRMTITGGTSGGGRGGGIAASNSTVSLSNSTVSNNQANNYAGGIYAVVSTVIISNSTVSGNSAGSGGGGIYAFISTVSLSNTTVSGNQADEFGGGIAAVDASTVSLSNSTVSGNSAEFGAGIAASNSSTVSLSNSTVSGNSAESGGGIYARRSSNVSLSNSTVSGNSALYIGGGIIANGSTVSLSNSIVSGNSVGYGGGGIFASNSSTVSLSNSTVSGNSTNFRGGGIFAYNSTVSLSNSTVSGNSANFYGGIFAISTSTVSLSNSIVANSLGGDCAYISSATNINIDTATIIEDGSCGAERSGDPGLLPLADNGGETLTHALSPTSISLNSGIFSGAAAGFENCTSEDQRGEARDNGDGACDVGAFEANVQTTNFFVIPLSDGRAVVIPL